MAPWGRKDITLNIDNRCWHFKADDDREFDVRLTRALRNSNLRTVRTLYIGFHPHDHETLWMDPTRPFLFNSHMRLSMYCECGRPREICWKHHEDEVDLELLVPLDGTSRRFEAALRCLELLASYLSTRIDHTKTSLSLDFIAHAPEDARLVFECLQPISPVNSVAVGLKRYTKNYHPARGGQTLVQHIVRTASRVLAPRREVRLFRWSNLPLELQRLILRFAVTDASLIPLDELFMSRDIDHWRLHAKRCCGTCRASVTIHNDGQCRCTNNNGDFSTTCTCVYLASGVFFANKALRSEALPLFWKCNTFLLNGPVKECFCPDGLDHADGENLDFDAPKTLPPARTCMFNVLYDGVPRTGFRHIRRLVIDTDWPLEAIELPKFFWTTPHTKHGGWSLVLFEIEERFQRNDLEVEIRIARFDDDELSLHPLCFQETFRHHMDGPPIPDPQELIRDRALFVSTAAELLKLKLKVWERLENGERLMVIE